MVTIVLLSDAETEEGCGRSPCLSQDLSNALLLIFGKGLLDQAYVLHKAGYAPLDDLGKGCFRLALIASSLFSDSTLVLDDIGWHLIASDILRCEGCDVLCDRRKGCSRRPAQWPASNCSRYLSASSAAMQPVPAEVMACR